MRKIILLLSFGLLFSCSKNNNDILSTNNGMDYEFTITVNGQVHKVKGNSGDGIPYQTNIGPPLGAANTCITSFSSFSGAGVLLGINDITAPNYISGQNMLLMIILPNPLLGINQATLSFTGSYFDSLGTSLGALAGFQLYSSTNVGTPNSKIPIIITDLGTSRTLVNNGSTYNFGQTIKGNYSGTIYLARNSGYNIPVQLSIDFKALRLN
jgi:hypothetical protein